MKKTILLVVLSFLAFISNAQEHKKYYDNGQLEEVGNYKDGKEDGEWKYYYENGDF